MNRIRQIHHPFHCSCKAIDTKTVASLLFRVYQQQQTGKLSLFENSANKKGFSNFEFEVKFFTIAKGLMSGKSVNMDDMEGLSDWISDLLVQNNNKLPVTFSQAQKNTYINFVNLYNTNFMGDNYQTMCDPILNEPTSAISIINSSICQ